MADMFGSPIGTRARDADRRSDIATGLNAAQTLGELAMQPDTARLRKTQADAAELVLRQEQEMSRLMRLSMGQQEGGEAQAPTSIADQLDTLARNAAGAGLVSKAQSLAKDAALIRSRENAASASRTTQQLNQLKAIKERTDLTAQLLGGATDEESWKRANALYQFQTGQISPFADSPYNPQLVERLNEAALTAKERLDAAEKGLTRRSLDSFRRGRLSQHDTALALRKRAKEIAAEREARLARTGTGKAIVAPTKGEVDQASRLIKKDIGDGMDAADLNDAAFTVAAQARALRKANPALDAAAALQQALAQAQQAGDFQKDTGIFGTGINTKVKFAGRGKTAAAPAAIPKEQKALVKDRFYVNASGQVAKWTGKGFVIERSLSENNSRLDPDLEDDEDEEE